MSLTTRLPTRLVICVDGTWCSADGPRGKGDGNTSNIYRLYASVKKGRCRDSNTGCEFIQDKLYLEGMGSRDRRGSLRRLAAGVFGEGYEDLIKIVYHECSKLNADDEIWLYGYSRGAFIVRAVAGLLHQIGVLQSAGTDRFDGDYQRALRVYQDAKFKNTIGPGQMHCFYDLEKKETPAAIQFVGVFDTVHAIKDGNLFDLTFNESIKHLRHALALNETRDAMTPEILLPRFEMGSIPSEDRTMIQAWFAGTHGDIGGSSRQDGLSLYPLQWMLLESQFKGLQLEFADTNGRLPFAIIDNPLEVVFPDGASKEKGIGIWSCTTQNNISVAMEDMRRVHDSPRYGERYSIAANFEKLSLWPKRARNVFDKNGTLIGSIDYAPQGTIIHPSVYQLLDTGHLHSLSRINPDLCENLRRWTSKILGMEDGRLKMGFWSENVEEPADSLGTIRVLVVGNTGVGKSTLINRVFGVDMTQTSHREQGHHNIREELIHPDRPELIVHDSGGFEAGGTNQLEDLEAFVKDKSKTRNLEDRIHVIWLCLELNSSRVKQNATIEVFQKVSKYADDIPIIIMATKADQFYAVKVQEARERFEEDGLEDAEVKKQSELEATEAIQSQLQLIEKELLEVEGGRFDACVSCRCSPSNSQKDRDSVSKLTEITMECFTNERVRLIYVATQVANIDLKIDCSIMKIMQIYKRILRFAAVSGSIPGAALTSKSAAMAAIYEAVLSTFGVSAIGWKNVQEFIKNSFLECLGHNIETMMVECVAAIGMFGSVAALGAPVFLATGAAALPVVVPTITRLILMLGGDLVLILTRAYLETRFTGVSQPLQEHIEQAVVTYRPTGIRVHKEVTKLIKRKDVVKAFNYADVQKGLEDIIDTYKTKNLKEIKELDAQHRAGKRNGSIPPLTVRSQPSSFEIGRIEQEVKEELELDRRDLARLERA